MNRPRYVPLSPGHDAPLGALDLFEIYTLAILSCGFFQVARRAEPAWQVGCVKRAESLKFHGEVSCLVEQLLFITWVILGFFRWR